MVSQSQTLVLCSCVRLIAIIISRMQSEQTVNMVRKLAIDYVNFIKECWAHASVLIVNRHNVV